MQINWANQVSLLNSLKIENIASQWVILKMITWWQICFMTYQEVYFMIYMFTHLDYKSILCNCFWHQLVKMFSTICVTLGKFFPSTRKERTQEEWLVFIWPYLLSSSFMKVKTQLIMWTILLHLNQWKRFHEMCNFGLILSIN